LAKLGIITGSKLEAACLKHCDPATELDIHCSGALAERANVAARTSVAAGCEGLVSFGLAGGLDPALPSGSLVVADAVICADGSKIQTDRSWVDGISRTFEKSQIPFVTGEVLGLDEIAFLPETKRSLFSGTGALCVDMESHAVIRAASLEAIPFIALRVVADTASDEIPRAASRALRADGGVQVGSLVFALAKRPTDIAGLLKLRKLSAVGFETLRRVAPLLSFCRAF
jgi:hopanoid-associated phosphorylase